MNVSPSADHKTRFLTVVIWHLIFLTGWAGSAMAQRAVGALDRDTLGTGDLFSYHIRISGIEAYPEVSYPDSSSFAPDFLIHDLLVIRDSRGDSLIYSLQFFGVDTDVIPELYTQLIADTDTVYLVIPEKSFVYRQRVDDPEAELRPLKPIFPFRRTLWPLVLAALMLTGVGAYLLYYFRERFFGSDKETETLPESPPEPFHNPLENLRTELNRIEDRYTHPEKQVKAYYTDLGDAFRTYLEHAWKIPALESTTTGVKRAMEEKKLHEEVIHKSHILFREADLVKFARFRPENHQCRQALDDANLLAELILALDRKKIEEMRKEHEHRQQDGEAP